jgi:hypothetical protein
MSESSSDRLWQEYGLVFKEFDDLTLARWLAQTLGQIQGKIWRFSHPLIGAYRLAAEIADDRQIWHKRLATSPAAFTDSACCRAPLLPLFTRDILEVGLICQHCSETAVPLEEIPVELQRDTRDWAAEYARFHAIAHWDDRQRKADRNYDATFENAAKNTAHLLSQAHKNLLPRYLDYYPAIIWEDQDECLEVRPDEIN